MLRRDRWTTETGGIDRIGRERAAWVWIAVTAALQPVHDEKADEMQGDLAKPSLAPCLPKVQRSRCSIPLEPIAPTSFAN